MRRTTAALLLILAVAPSHAEPPLPGVESVAWIAGYWAGGEDDRTYEEVWLPASGSVMVGVHRDVSGDDAFFEYLRIEQRGSNTFYVSKPSNQPEAEFRLVSACSQDVVFENLEHDYPQRITYELDGDVLTVTISGMVKGEERSSTWIMKRARLNQEER